MLCTVAAGRAGTEFYSQHWQLKKNNLYDGRRDSPVGRARISLQLLDI